MKKRNKIILIIVGIIIGLIIILPFIKIKNGNKVTYYSLFNDSNKYNPGIRCYDEGIFYDTDKKISITDLKVDNYFILNKISYKLHDGNICNKEYVLSDNLLNLIINDAEVLENKDKIDLKQEISGLSRVETTDAYFNETYAKKILIVSLNNSKYNVYVYSLLDYKIIELEDNDGNTVFAVYE